jgi:hypothetical protein
MNYTNHYNLNKPELAEQFNLDDWNDNSDAIDTQMFQNETNINTIVSALTTKDVSSADTLYSKLMKLVYEPKTKKFYADYKYENQTTDDISVFDNYDNWFEELQNSIRN